MRTSRSARASARRATRVRKSSAPKRVAKPAAKPVRPGPAVPEQVFYRLCRAGWAVVVEKTPNAMGTRFVCPFCPVSHHVPGPVRGFRKVRRAQWIKFRRVTE